MDIWEREENCMATAQQRAASRKNGARSRGPTSASGKSRSSMNSLKSGMTAKKLYLPDDDPQQRQRRNLELLAQLNPQTPTQVILADRLLHASYQRECCDETFVGTIVPQARSARVRYDRKIEDQVEAV